MPLWAEELKLIYIVDYKVYVVDYPTLIFPIVIAQRQKSLEYCLHMVFHIL